MFLNFRRWQQSLMKDVEAHTKEASALRGSSKRLAARLASAESQVSCLELQKLELEQAAVEAEGALRERELAVQKVQLQCHLRDRALAMLCGSLRRRLPPPSMPAAPPR